ncbi:MAG TPA: Flp pilus assembly protein CpaB [Gemmataceae bacterium]|nr:Flp pilus assembly protein CpaB [Gemmataceae bacterium]
MKPKTMMLMVVAVGCGLAASYMTSRLLAERSNGPAEEQKVKVLVAKAKVPAWVLIKEPEKYFEEKDVAESAVPKKALKELAKVKGQRLSQALVEGDYVQEDKLVNAEQSGLLAKLPSGMRAIAVKVNAETLAGGFVLPGSRVDVVSTLRGGSSESESKIIMQNMLVLAVDTTAVRDTQTQSILGSTVTLAATPEEANRLALATALGELRLTLRTPDDTRIVRLPGAKWGDLGKPTRDGSVNKDEETLSTSSAPPVPTLPPLPKELPTTPTPTPAVVKTPEKAPEPTPLQTHTLTIISGDYVQKAVFTMDPIEKVWTHGGLGRNVDDAAPRRSSPPPALTPAQPDDSSASPPPALGHGGTRGGRVH